MNVKSCGKGVRSKRSRSCLASSRTWEARSESRTAGGIERPVFSTMPTISLQAPCAVAALSTASCTSLKSAVRFMRPSKCQRRVLATPLRAQWRITFQHCRRRAGVWPSHRAARLRAADLTPALPPAARRGVPQGKTRAARRSGNAMLDEVARPRTLPVRSAGHRPAPNLLGQRAAAPPSLPRREPDGPRITAAAGRTSPGSGMLPRPRSGEGPRASTGPAPRSGRSPGGEALPPVLPSGTLGGHFV